LGEIYDYEERLRRCRRIIAGFGANGETALRFLDHLGSLGLTIARISKYACHIPAILRLVNFNLAEATRSDVERVVAAINMNRNWREWTKHDKKLILRKLIQYAKYGSCSRETPMPPEVAWVKLNVKGKDSRVNSCSLLTPEEFMSILNAAENIRDKAMLHVLFEGALRPGELLGMTVGSVEFREDYCLITVNGKTGFKRIPLVASYRLLLDWLEQHPNRSVLNAPLWCSLASNHVGERLSYKHFRSTVKRLSRKAGLAKDVWPYLFRHTTLTALAKVFTEARLEQFAGWTHGSKMSARYVHFSARDLEEAVLELYGKRERSNGVMLINLLKCPRCGLENSLGTVRCRGCGFILDRRLADEVRGREEEAKKREEEDRKIEELEKRTEELQRQLQQVSSLLVSLLSGRQVSQQQPSPAQQSSPADPQEPFSGQPQRRPSGGGSTNPAPGAYWHDSGAQVQVTAIPNQGYLFSH
jgi:integrase